jgi:hypothetical protein
MATSPGSTGNSPQDHSQLAGRYLILLGILSLLTLNLGGLLLIWFGAKVRERNEGFRKATIWLLGLGILGGVGIILWATLEGTDRVTVTLLFDVIKAPPLWLVYVVGIPALVFYSLPVYWLTHDTYKPQAPSGSELQIEE